MNQPFPQSLHHESATPSPTTVIGGLRDWRIRARIRLTVGGLFLVVATAVITASALHKPHITVLAARVALPAGHVMTIDELVVRRVVRDDAPRHPIRTFDVAVGRRLIGPIAGGDVLSRERFAAAPVSDSAVRISLAVDSATAQSLAPGDTVDVWCAQSPDVTVSQRAVNRIATSVHVVAVNARTDGLGDSSVLLAVPAASVPELVAAKAAGNALLLTRRQ